MTTRRESILEAIVREYVETAEPVGSLTLVEKFKFPFSSATIRAEMAELESEGYITHPHTSAGRIPTEKGYRYFVDMIEKEKWEMAYREERSLRKRIGAMHSDYNRMFNAATVALAELTRNVGLSMFDNETFSHGIANLFRQPEFLDYAQMLKVAELLDNLPYLMHEIPKNKDFLIMIGQESPIGKAANCSLIVTKVKTPLEVSGYLGVLGPTRMPYERIITLVSGARSLLEEETYA